MPMPATPTTLPAAKRLFTKEELNRFRFNPPKAEQNPDDRELDLLNEGLAQLAAQAPRQEAYLNSAAPPGGRFRRRRSGANPPSPRQRPPPTPTWLPRQP